MKKELNLDEIKRLYIEENKTLTEIAQLMNCGYGTIQKRVKEIGFTNCFSEEEINLLITQIKQKWNISCTKQHQLGSFIIYLPKSSRLDFERLIFPYILPSMYYKLKYLDLLKAELVDKTV